MSLGEEREMYAAVLPGDRCHDAGRALNGAIFSMVRPPWMLTPCRLGDVVHGMNRERLVTLLVCVVR
jgi:hypothetical protein